MPSCRFTDVFLHFKGKGKRGFV